MTKRSGALFIAGLLALAACSGEDGGAGPSGPSGPTGPAGPTGPTGPEGDDAFFTTVESCATCHGGTLAQKHAAASANQVIVSNEAVVTPVATDTDLAITFNVKVDGVNANDFTHIAGAYSWVYNAAVGAGTRTTLTTTGFTVTQSWNGNYRVTLPGFGPAGATPAAADATILLRMDTGNSQPQATVIVHNNAPGVSPFAVVSDQACKNCHGENVFHGRDPVTGLPTGHRGANPPGVEGCVVCHDRDSNAEARLVTLGTRLMGYVHGIHNSHNMPDGVYSRSNSTDPEDQFSIGFPGYMNNCATCHDTAAALAAVNAAQVSWATCISCHDGMTGFSNIAAATTGTLNNHKAYTAATDCSTCHNGTVAPATVSAFHNGSRTGRSGLIWNGADQSVVQGQRVVMSIDSVAVSGTDLVVTWSATLDGTAVDPCNQTVGDSAPVFFGATANAATGQAASNMTFLRSYALANDWVNDGLTGSTSPGQPAGTVTPSSTNTTCAANVATTTFPAQTTTATKGVIALQGKPQIRFAPAAGTTSEVIQIRAKTPTREFMVADGAAPTAAAARRQPVSIDQCNKCHLGSMYQHGGNRVDNTNLCVMCHNPAASENNVRVNMGVDAAEAYDGRAGETYDLRYMVHAIHSAGESGQPLVYYRTNGIYFFGTKEALAKVSNWPGTGCQVVAGSGAPSSATGTQCDTTNTTAVTKNHNFIEIHYPRPLNDCAACHVGGSEQSLPDPTRSVAVTYAAGAAPWNNLTDDVLLGPSAATCMSCHQSGDPVGQFGLRIHAYGQGWAPTTFDDGRQTLIDAVTLP